MKSIGYSPERPGDSRLRVGLFGCAMTTGNHGVTALALSMVSGLGSVGIPLEIVVFGTGKNSTRTSVPDSGRVARVEIASCYESRRYYRLDNISHLRVANRLGLRRMHPVLRKIGRLDLVFDLSGGDSFSDIYRRQRFDSICAPKALCMEMGVPLILAPQTYGPYRERSAGKRAAEILRAAKQVWTRDPNGLDLVRSLLEDDFDPSVCHAGVDVAFGLDRHQPADAFTAERILEFEERTPTVVGLNVSGLLHARKGREMGDYGLRDPYYEIVDQLLERLLSRSDTGVMLVPHVSSTQGANRLECDFTALKGIFDRLSSARKQRVLLLPPDLLPTEIKWAIGRCDWFCGTRLHSCIAALSQGVPAAAIAYSDKSRGVFDTLGLGGSVVDPRRYGKAEVVERIMAGLDEKKELERSLEARLPVLMDRWREQFMTMLTSSPARTG